MAVYKVPQDVEADDKLIGPFSFRQFIYLIIVCISIFIAWGLWQLFIPLAILPLPVIIFFGALALPLRKDQPMEIYMAAMVSFYLKPRRRLWNPDGMEELIEITVPKIVEVQRSKDISQTEAQRRLSYLAEIVDSQGWAVRGTGMTAPNSAMNSDVYFEAQQTQDIFDPNASVARSVDEKLVKSDANRHKEMVGIAHGQAPTKQPSTAPSDPAPSDELTANSDQPLKYNPYPDIKQAMVQPPDPADAVVTTPPVSTSEKAVPAGIINLANNADLSIATIAREASRIQKKNDLEEEVVISLR